jgi:hypothetical protein
MKIHALVAPVLFAILIFGCTQQTQNAFARHPTDNGTIEATVLSVTQDANGARPNDYATIRVDRILSYQRDPAANYPSLHEGEVLNASLAYSTRPAILRHVSMATIKKEQEARTEISGNGDTYPLPDSVPRENGKYVYEELSKKPGGTEYKTSLPGMLDGDRIKVQVYYTDPIYQMPSWVASARMMLREYELISEGSIPRRVFSDEDINNELAKLEEMNAFIKWESSSGYEIKTIEFERNKSISYLTDNGIDPSGNPKAIGILENGLIVAERYCCDGGCPINGTVLLIVRDPSYNCEEFGADHKGNVFGTCGERCVLAPR